MLGSLLLGNCRVMCENVLLWIYDVVCVMLYVMLNVVLLLCIVVDEVRCVVRWCVLKL